MTPIWHVTDVANRVSIASRGLIPAGQVNAPEQATGVYGFRAATAAEAWELFKWDYGFPGDSYDVWRIDTERLTSPIEDDPAWHGEAVFVNEQIPVSLIELAGTYTA